MEMYVAILIIFIVIAAVDVIYIIVNAIMSAKNKDTESKVNVVIDAKQLKEALMSLELEKAKEKEENSKNEEPIISNVSNPIKEETNSVISDNMSAQGVQFNNSKKLREKYSELQKNEKKYFDQIDNYISNVEKIQRSENTERIDYRIGRVKIARLTIKRNKINCECFFINNEFSQTISSSKTKVKQSGPICVVQSDEDVDAVKKIIDVSISEYSKFLIDKKNARKAALKEKKVKESE